MSDALAATEMVLAREQQLHALDGLAAAAAHELGTPLSTIAVVAKELARTAAKDGHLAEDIALLQSQAERCREILKKLTREPKEPDPLHARISVRELIEEAAAPYQGFNAEIVIRAGAEPGTDAGAGREPVGERRPGVIYGIANLVENAVDFARQRVEITATWTAREVAISIADDGAGIPPPVLDALGEPYVTTRPARAGRPVSGLRAVGHGPWVLHRQDVAGAIRGRGVSRKQWAARRRRGHRQLAAGSVRRAGDSTGRACDGCRWHPQRQSWYTEFTLEIWAQDLYFVRLYKAWAPDG